MPYSNDFIKRVLIAADHAIKLALKSAAAAGDRTSNEVDKKFREAIHLLSDFEKDFPSQVAVPPIFGSDVSSEANISDKSQSPFTILNALKENLHAKVEFFHLFLYLDADNSKS
jgi:hypothetical protein